jgi:hypothetical protein
MPLQSRSLEVAPDLCFGSNDSCNDGALQCGPKFAQVDLAQGEAKLAELSARIREVVASKDVETVYNADQTGINYEYIQKRR